ncbi:MAG: YraN family protein [Verrucomicrobiota bacterium]|nr:YraN family protein [Verrucomicrobiota bacterium]MEC9227886.1 YraN family protein [Verrucomicrobiota bacterium]
MNLLPFIKSPTALSPDVTSAERGAYGEAMVADYCKRILGYKLITRNWHGSRGELDLIFSDKDTLVIIEVRAREEDALVSSYHSIDVNKKAVLHRTCRQYLN